MSLRLRAAVLLLTLPALTTTERVRSTMLNATQAPPVASIDLRTLGPKVGETVPDFTLRDQRGQMRSLPSVMGRKGVMLVFFRSADW